MIGGGPRSVALHAHAARSKASSRCPRRIQFAVAAIAKGRLLSAAILTTGAIMSTAAERSAQLDLVSPPKSSFPELPNAPTPDMLDSARIKAYLKPVHDVGGEPDAP